MITKNKTRCFACWIAGRSEHYCGYQSEETEFAANTDDRRQLNTERPGRLSESLKASSPRALGSPATGYNVQPPFRRRMLCNCGNSHKSSKRSR